MSLNQVLLHRLQSEVSSEVCNLLISSYFSFSIHHSNHGGLMTRTWTGVGLICLPDFENKGHSQRTHTTYFDKKTGRKTGKKQPKFKSGAFKRPGSGCLLSFLSAAKPKPADFQRVWFFRQMSYRFAVSTRHSALGTRHSTVYCVATFIPETQTLNHSRFSKKFTQNLGVWVSGNKRSLSVHGLDPLVCIWVCTV